MKNPTLCFKVPKRHGGKTLALVNRMKIVNGNLKVRSDEDFVYIPLNDQPPEATINTIKRQVASLEISTYSFHQRKKPQPSLIDLLGDKLAPHLLASLPHAMDVVGDIAIIELSHELAEHRKIIGEAILKANKNVRTVLAKAGAVSGTYRLREFTIIAGEPRTETIHKEYGCQYYIDISKVYFSPRLSNEHNRVANLVEEGETVADLFAGVGPFAIQIAKNHEKAKVYAIDLNPDAVEYLKRNIRLNKVVGKVRPILGDARHVVNEQLSGIADRVIMNLPEKAIDFLDAGTTALKPAGGTIHFYRFINASDSMENIKSEFTEMIEKLGGRVKKISSSRRVRETAPYEWQAVLDANIG